MLLILRAYDGTARRCWTNEEVLRSDRSETQFVAAGSVDGAAGAVAGHDSDLGDNDGVSPLDSNGHMSPDAHRYARMFQSDLELFEGISGTWTHFEVWSGDWR